MVLGLFGSKRKREDIHSSMVRYFLWDIVLSKLEKAQSLQKLGRKDESRQLLLEMEQTVMNYLKDNPHEKEAHMMLVLFYKKAGDPDRAEPTIERLLNSTEFQLSDEERLSLSRDLQNIRRRLPLDQRDTDSPRGFTQIYCCAKCGRLHNFVSMPCPHCDWSPQSIEEMARSMFLSNAHFKVPTLLLLAREMAEGRAADDVVLNLLDESKTYLNAPHRRILEQVFSGLRQNEHKNRRSIGMARECSTCRHHILFSGAEKCQKCGAKVNWPEAIRLLVCMDNLLRLFEQRVEVSTKASSTDEFADFVCVLVAMTNNLLRKQADPSIRDRQYSLQLLTAMVVICDLNKGAYIDTSNPKDLKISLIKDHMREDTEPFATFLFRELQFFVAMMTDGVRY